MSQRGVLIARKVAGQSIGASIDQDLFAGIGIASSFCRPVLCIAVPFHRRVEVVAQ
jgi:hypothetical protein